MGFFQRLSQGLKKTKDTMMRQLSSLFSSSKLDGDFYEELEELLVISDVGVSTAEKNLCKASFQGKGTRDKRACSSAASVKRFAC